MNKKVRSFTIVLIDEDGNERVYNVITSSFYYAFLIAKHYVSHAECTENVYLFVKSITDKFDIVNICKED